MKNLLKKILILFVVFLAFSCSKDEVSNPNYKLSKIITDGLQIKIKYRNDNRIESFINDVNDSSTVFTYFENTTISTSYTNGEFSSRTTITNNSDGLATEMLYEYGNNLFYKNVYQYNGTEVSQQSYTSSTITTPQITNYIWSNGNLIQIGNSYLTYYEDKTSQVGEYLHIFQLLGGFEYIKSKNSIKSISQNNQSQNFSYTYDSGGKIIAMAVTAINSSPQILNYEYTIN